MRSPRPPLWGQRGRSRGLWLWASCWVLLAAVAAPLPAAVARSSATAFQHGTEAYQAGQVAEAAKYFQQAARDHPAAGTLQNLGLAEWLKGRSGHAVLAWEQALWLDTFNTAVRGNLSFARKKAQIESPELRWYEVVSTWLPVNWWVWISGVSLWLAVALAVVPGVLRVTKTSWHQAVAAVSLMIFLLSLPAQLGIHTRSRVGFVLRKDTPLRLTPTVQSQVITLLSPGEPGRLHRVRGNYLLVRTSRGDGWVDKDLFGTIVPR